MTSGRAPASPSSRRCPSIAKIPSPPARPATWSARRCPPAPSTPAPRTASSSRTAGRPATRSSRSTTNSTSRPEAVADFLKNASDGKGVFNVDIFALEKESAEATPKDTVLVAPLGLTASRSPRRNPGRRRRHPEQGHRPLLHVPEQRDFYEAWVDFTVKDGAGKTLAESGFIQPDGYLDPSAHSFTNRLVNVKGELNDLHQIWHNRVLAYNNAFQSGRSQLVRYRFRLPKDIAGKVS
jgi:hypothetical protein